MLGLFGWGERARHRTSEHGRVHFEVGGFHADGSVETEVDLGQALDEAGFEGARWCEFASRSWGSAVSVAKSNGLRVLRRPCLKAFSLTRALPSAVRGPVDFNPLAWFAAILAADAVDMCSS